MMRDTVEQDQWSKYHSKNVTCSAGSMPRRQVIRTTEKIFMDGKRTTAQSWEYASLKDTFSANSGTTSPVSPAPTTLSEPSTVLPHQTLKVPWQLINLCRTHSFTDSYSLLSRMFHDYDLFKDSAARQWWDWSCNLRWWSRKWLLASWKTACAAFSEHSQIRGMFWKQALLTWFLCSKIARRVQIIRHGGPVNYIDLLSLF